MKLELTPTEKSTLLPEIKRVLEGGEGWEDKMLHYPAGAIIDAVLSIEGVAKDDGNEEAIAGFLINGWQYDWWQDFTHNGKKYTLCGSGYYGGHSFRLADE